MSCTENNLHKKRLAQNMRNQDYSSKGQPDGCQRPGIVEWINQIYLGAATIAETAEAQDIIKNMGLDINTKLYNTQHQDSLSADILMGMKKIVILTGNAGDGKTHFIKKIIKDLKGRPHCVELDASARTDDELITWFIEALQDARKTSIIAINEGRLRYIGEKLNRYIAPEVSSFAKELIGVIENKGEFSNKRIALVNLRYRAVVDKAIFDALLDKFIDKKNWQPCLACSGSCNIVENIQRLKQPLIRQRLRLLLTYVYLKGFHITMRDLLLVFAKMITAGRRGEENPDLYYNNVFDISEGQNMPLICKKICRFDPAKGSNNDLDPHLYFSIYKEIISDEFIVEPERDNLPEGELSRLRMLRRKTFFEVHEDRATLLQHPQSILPYRFVEIYMNLAGGASPNKILPDIILALNRLDDPNSLAKNNLHIWDIPNAFGIASSKYAVLREKIEKRRLSLVPIKIQNKYLETMPEYLELSVDSKVALKIDLSLFEFMMLAAHGFSSKQMYGSHLPRIQAFKDKLLDYVVKSKDHAQCEFEIQVFSSSKPCTLYVLLDDHEIDISRGG